MLQTYEVLTDLKALLFTIFNWDLVLKTLFFGDEISLGAQIPEICPS